jgi:hypothetical protein
MVAFPKMWMLARYRHLTAMRTTAKNGALQRLTLDAKALHLKVGISYPKMGTIPHRQAALAVLGRILYETKSGEAFGQASGLRIVLYVNGI